MFLKQRATIYPDLSNDLADPQDWEVGELKRLEFPRNITTFAIDPISGLLAIGTNNGILYLFGAPGVECKLTLPERVPVNLLHFAISTFNLICVDQQSQLHVWDLSSFGQPTYVGNARFNQINAVCLSPSLSHVFFAINSGDIKTYDLACLRKSQYNIPNMWKLYEEKTISKDTPSQNVLRQASVDIVIHPRDLNLLFVAYGGGIILSDISQRNTLRIFELILPPGAPGGHEYMMESMFAQRNPIVTAIAVHPSGHIFAVGYEDGSIAFWATGDDDCPILVRTLSKLDVNLVDADILNAHLEGKQNISGTHTVREPIFKLTWSGFPNSEDPRGGITALTILGGLTSEQGAGLSIMILPPLNPPDHPASESTSLALHPVIRTAIRDSLNPLEILFYPTSHPIQDYLLIPQGNPYFSGTFDPYGILVLIETTDGDRIVEGYQYPPSPARKLINAGIDKASPPDGPGLSRVNVINPTKLVLPFALTMGHSGMLGGVLVSLDREVYEIFISVPPRSSDTHVRLSGGSAWLDGTKANEVRLSKYQRPRVLITYHQDLTVHFHDMSTQLLISPKSEPIQHHFPESIEELTIDLRPLLHSEKVNDITISGVYFAEESFEMAVALSDGKIVFFRPVMNFTASYSEALDKEIKLVLEEHLPEDKTMAPYFTFTAPKGHPRTVSISNIGFTAISYDDGSLYVVDMRGPHVLLRPSQMQMKHKKTPSVGFGARHHNSEPMDSTTALQWVVSPLAEARRLQVRLIVARASGRIETYHIFHNNDTNSWIINGEPLESKGVADPLPNGCYVLDSKTGVPCNASKEKLAASLRNADEVLTTDCFLVLVGVKDARTYANINGERIGKAEWGHKFGAAKTSCIIERMGNRVLLIFNEHLSGFIYSLPHLEHLHTIQLPLPPSMKPTVDSTGDFIAFVPSEKHPIHSAVYGTVFDVRRISTSSDLDLTRNRTIIPAQPQPVSLGPASMLDTWFNMKKTMNSEQMDAFLGGPDRPIIRKQHASSVDNPVADSSAANVATNIVAAASAAQSNLYSRLTSALGERSQLLGDLEDRFNSLEEGSKSMVSQAKKLAAQQTAKGWFGMS